MALSLWVVDGATVNELRLDAEVNPVHNLALLVAFESVGGEEEKGEEEETKEHHGFLNYKKKKMRTDK